MCMQVSVCRMTATTSWSHGVYWRTHKAMHQYTRLQKKTSNGLARVVLVQCTCSLNFYFTNPGYMFVLIVDKVLRTELARGGHLLIVCWDMEGFLNLAAWGGPG